MAKFDIELWNDDRLFDLWEKCQLLFDLFWLDILSTGDELPIFAADNCKASLCRPAANIARWEPVAGSAETGTSHEDLSICGEFHLSVGKWLSEIAGAISPEGAIGAEHERGHLCESIAYMEGPPQTGRPII